MSRGKEVCSSLSICWSCRNKVPRTYNRNLFIHHRSGGWKSKFKVPAGVLSGEGSPCALRMDISVCATVPSPCVRACGVGWGSSKLSGVSADKAVILSA